MAEGLLGGILGGEKEEDKAASSNVGPEALVAAVAADTVNQNPDVAAEAIALFRKQTEVLEVQRKTLETEPALSHISGGSSPTFTVQVENSGEFPETNVKVDVTVTSGGKQFSASHVIEKTEPGKTVNVDIPVTGVPVGVASKIEINIEGVPGENDLENNKGTFLAIFGP